MASYLLTWNPQKWPWEDIQEDIDEISEKGFAIFRWSCGNSKRIGKGDRVFLLRQGLEPRGICGSGRAESSSFEKIHWRAEKAEEGRTTRYVKVRWDILLNAETESIFPREWLNERPLSDVNWNTQISGISIPDDVADVLEEKWKGFLERRKKKSSGMDANYGWPGEVSNVKEYWKGAVSQIYVNRYERDNDARKKCLEYYGFDCYVCDFNFERVYGEAGRDLIQVHHLKPLSEIGEKYRLDPVKDLRPVCPNCHAIIHRRNPPYSIEEMIELLHGETG